PLPHYSTLLPHCSPPLVHHRDLPSFPTRRSSDLRQQEQEAKADKPGAAECLGAAKALQAELAKILEGEPPYDIFVRWKPLKEQPDRKSTRLNSSHEWISYAVFCWKKKTRECDTHS